MFETLGIHFPSLLIYLVNFLLVLGILLLFAYRPILRLMDQRADRIPGKPGGFGTRTGRGRQFPGGNRGAAG